MVTTILRMKIPVFFVLNLLMVYCLIMGHGMRLILRQNINYTKTAMYAIKHT